MIELGPLEERLALFAEGIAGRYFHIKASGDFAGRRASLDPEHSALTMDSLYLPEQLDAPDASAYRVLTLQQLGRREFGTYRFSMTLALARIPELGQRQAPTLGGRTSDFETFYHQFAEPALASRLLHLCERVRIDALMLRAYPGIAPALARYRQHQLERRSPEAATGLAAVLNLLECWTLRADPALLAGLDFTACVAPAAVALDALARQPGDVHESAATAFEIYRLLEPLAQQPQAAFTLPLEEEPDEPAGWMQREARLEDWRQDLAALDAALSVEVLQGDEAEAAAGENLTDGQLRPEDIDLRTLAKERDTLARRIDMERSAIRDALGAERPQARSFRYDEWDYLQRGYLPRWCRLFEERLPADYDQDLDALRRLIQTHRATVAKRFEQIKPLGYQRVRRVADGDELDFNAVIEARQDSRAGHSPDERVYSRRDRVQRDVCAALLVDLSASTDDTVDPPPPVSDVDDSADIWDAEPASATETVPRRIIDVQRDAMLVMSAALEQLGDSYGVYGFSGYGRDCVEFFVAKEPAEPFGRHTLAAIAGMQPKRSTRMGPAIRHSVRKLLASGNALKVLLIISDGFPQDCDYGPERGEHEYALQDTARALREASEKGVETFCITVDRCGHDYLKRMCPESRYMVIEEIEDLPEQLGKVYQALTS